MLTIILAPFICAGLLFITICNLYVAHSMTIEEMKNDFITEQGTVGRICANGFYALAWALKGIKIFVK